MFSKVLDIYTPKFVIEGQVSVYDVCSLYDTCSTLVTGSHNTLLCYMRAYYDSSTLL